MAKRDVSKGRGCRFFGTMEPAAEYPGGTWLESEAFCYPSGGMRNRRARAIVGGKLRVVRCGIPDTVFTIPAYCGGIGAGYLTIEPAGVTFHASRKD